MCNLTAALKLIEQGFYVFPCRGVGDSKKVPLLKGNWQQLSTTNKEQIISWWQAYPHAVPAIDVIKSNYLILDADKRENLDGVELLEALFKRNALDIKQIPKVYTPSGGCHYYFKQPLDKLLGNTTGSLPKGIDVRGKGGYVIGSGASFKDGGSYRQEGDLQSAYHLPEWMVNILTASKVESKVTDTAMSNYSAAKVELNYQNLDNYIHKIVASELSALQAAPLGGRNNALNQASFKLGTLVGADRLEYNFIQSELENIGLAIGLPLYEIRATISSGLKAGIANPRDFSNIGSSYGGSYSTPLDDSITDGILEDGEDEPIEASKTFKAGVDLDYPAGIIGDIARYMVATARKPQKNLSIGAAFALLSTLTGRQFCSPTRSATHLYILNMAGTGKGKDHPLKMVLKILQELNLAELIGTSEFISMTAIIQLIKRKPLSLSVMDEFGGFLKRVMSKKASNFEGAIPKLLRTLWSCSFEPYITPEWASKAAEVIHSPAMSLLGATTEGQFYQALEDGALEDGTLNRFLLFKGDDKLQEQSIIEDISVPQSLLDNLQQIYQANGALSAIAKLTASSEVSPIQLGWAPDGSEDIYKALVKECDDIIDNDETKSYFLGRSPEMAVRLATLIAIGRQNRVVTADDMIYAKQLVLNSANYMLDGASQFMASSDHQAKVQKVLRCLKARKGRATRSQLLKSLCNSMKSKDLQEILSDLVESGYIAKQEQKTARHIITIYSIK